MKRKRANRTCWLGSNRPVDRKLAFFFSWFVDDDGDNDGDDDQDDYWNSIYASTGTWWLCIKSPVFSSVHHSQNGKFFFKFWATILYVCPNNQEIYSEWNDVATSNQTNNGIMSCMWFDVCVCVCPHNIQFEIELYCIRLATLCIESVLYNVQVRAYSATPHTQHTPYTTDYTQVNEKAKNAIACTIFHCIMLLLTFSFHFNCTKRTNQP